MSKTSEEPPFYVLEEDKRWARQRVAELERAIQDLGHEFNVALNQSNETWHDNAPFDTLRDTQALMVAEMQNLKETLFKAAIRTPVAKKGKVGIGSQVMVQHGNRTHTYIVAGHWSPRAGTKEGEAMIISCVSPIGSVLMGSGVGDEVVIPTNNHRLVITNVV